MLKNFNLKDKVKLQLEGPFQTHQAWEQTWLNSLQGKPQSYQAENYQVEINQTKEKMLKLNF